MTVHVIRMRGRELRTVIWDDEAGNVDGDHWEVPWIRETLARETPFDLGNDVGPRILNDPNPQARCRSRRCISLDLQSDRHGRGQRH